jgi:hypothetical protein
VPFGDRESPCEDLLSGQLGKRHVTQLDGCLPEQPAELRDRDAFTLMRVQVLRDPLAEHQSARTVPGRSRASLFCSARCASQPCC